MRCIKIRIQRMHVVCFEAKPYIYWDWFYLKMIDKIINLYDKLKNEISELVRYLIRLLVFHET